MSKLTTPLPGDPVKTKEINPASELGTVNPALSIPYIKYYTSLLEEYQEVESATGNISQLMRNMQRRSPEKYAFPSYLRFKPFKQLNEFPAIQTYQPDSSFVKVFNEKQYNTLLKTSERAIKKVPYTSTRGNTDIILTYRAVKSRGSVKKLGQGIQNKEGATVSDVYSMITNDLTREAMKRTTYDCAIGNSSTLASYGKQFLHAMYIHKLIIIDYKKHNLPVLNIIASEMEKYSLKQQRLLYMIYPILNNVNKMLTRLTEDAIRSVAISYGFVDSCHKIIEELKNHLIGTVREKIINESSSFKSYLQMQAYLAVIILHAISKITDLYIKMASSNIIQLPSNVRVKNGVVKFAAGSLAHSLGFKKTDFPNDLKLINWGSYSKQTSVSIQVENKFRTYITPLLSKFSKKSTVTYDSIFLKRYPQTDRLLDFIAVIYRLNYDKVPNYLDAFAAKLSGIDITQENLDEYVENATEFPDLSTVMSKGIEPTFSQDAYISTIYGKNIESLLGTTWKTSRIGRETSLNHIQVFATSIIDCTKGLLSISSFIQSSFGIGDSIRYKHLVIKNKEDIGRQISTTITKFDVSSTNRNIPIFMDGHDGPIVQNFGGPRTQIQMTIITNDVFLLDNISAAAQELDMAYRTRSEVNSTSPLGSTFTLTSDRIQTNSLIYNTTRRSLLRRMRSLVNKENIMMGSANVDAPILITNNIANMSGIYGIVINEIQVNSVEGFPGLFQLDVNMTSVDMNQGARETPKKLKAEVPPDLVIANLCRLNLYGMHYHNLEEAAASDQITSSAVFHANNVQFSVNYTMAKLAYMYWLTYYVFGMSRKDSKEDRKGISRGFNVDRTKINTLIGNKPSEGMIEEVYLANVEILAIFIKEFLGDRILKIFNSLKDDADISSAYRKIRNEYDTLLSDFLHAITKSKAVYIERIEKTRPKEGVDKKWSTTKNRISLLDFYQTYQTNQNTKNKQIKIYHKILFDREFNSLSGKIFPMKDNPYGSVILAGIGINNHSFDNVSGLGKVLVTAMRSPNDKISAIPSDVIYTMMMEFCLGIGHLPQGKGGTGAAGFNEMIQMSDKKKSNIDILVDKTLGMIVQGTKELRKTHICNTMFHKFTNSEDTNKWVEYLFATHNWSLKDISTIIGSKQNSTLNRYLKYDDNRKEFARRNGVTLDILPDQAFADIIGFTKAGLNKTLTNQRRIAGDGLATATYGEFAFSALLETYLKKSPKNGVVSNTNVNKSKLAALRLLFHNIVVHGQRGKNENSEQIEAREKLRRTPWKEYRLETKDSVTRLYNSDVASTQFDAFKAYRQDLIEENTFKMLSRPFALNNTVASTDILKKYGSIIPESLDILTPDELEEYTGVLIKSLTKINMKSTNIIMYRLLDSLTMKMIIPLMSNAVFNDDFKRSLNFSGDSINLASARLRMKKIKINPTLKKNIQRQKMSTVLTGAFSDTDLSTIQDIFTKGMKTLINPSLISVLIQTIGSSSLQLYDLYNSYPDRPLPLLHQAKTKIGERIVASLQLNTTPDFYIKKDASYGNLIVNALENKLNLAQRALDKETYSARSSNGFPEWTRKQQRRNLIEKGESARNLLNETKGGLYQRIESFVGRISFGETKAVNVKTKILEHYKRQNQYLYEYARAATGIYDFIGKMQEKLNSLNPYDLEELSKFIAERLKTLVESTKVNAAARKIINDLLIKQSLRDLSIQLSNIEQPVAQINSIINGAARISNKNHHLSSKDLVTIKSILNPSAAAYNTGSILMMKNKLKFLKSKMARTNPVSTLAYALPTFKFYIIEEDAKEWLFFNDFYDYGSLKSIKIHESRKDATSTAHIILSNIYGKLTNIISGMRSDVEKPLYEAPADEEEITSMMLREGARIQIRLGYNAHLDIDNIVFSGRIQQIQGTHEIVIVAQSDGVELTRTIGPGPGLDFSGILPRIQVKGKQAGKHNTNSALGLISGILDSAGAPLRGLGTRVPYLGSSRIRNITSERIPGITNELIPEGFLGGLERYFKSKILKTFTGLEPKLIDTRLTNINLSSQIGSNKFYETLFGKSRWLIHNETIWDSLQDYMLQLGDKICTVRPFDEENTIVIDDEDGIYQRSTENFITANTLHNMVSELENAEKASTLAIPTISDYISSERTLDKKNTPIRDLVQNALRDTALALPQKEAVFGKDGISELIEEIDDTIDLILKNLNNGADIRKLVSNGSVADKYDNASEYELDNLRTSLGIESDEKTKDIHGSAKKHFNKNRRQTVAEHLLCFSACMICKLLKHHVASSVKSFRPLSDVHLKTANKDIIKNNIRVVSGFNAVEMGYIDEDIAGSVLQIVGFDSLGSLFGLGRAISLDNVGKPSSYSKTRVQASPFLENDKVSVYATEQKNAAIRGSIIIDTPQITANSILGNLIRDYYDGELIILMDPTIKPHDSLFIHDDVHDMWGMIKVKEVTHSFSPETGAVTIVKPDVYVRNNLSGLRNTYSVGLNKPFMLRAVSATSSAIIFALTAGLGAGLGKMLTKGAVTAFRGAFKGVSKTITKSAAKGLITKNLTKLVKGKSSRQIKKAFGKKTLNNMADVIEASGKALPDTNKLLNRLNKAGVGIDDFSNSTKLVAETLDDVIATLNKSTDKVDNYLATTLDELLDSTIKNSRRRGKVDIGIDDVLKDIVTSDKMSKKSLKAVDTDLDTMIDKFTDTLVNSKTILPSNNTFATILSNTLISNTWSLTGNVRGLGNIFSFRAFKSIIMLGLSKKLGRIFIPSFEGFSTFMGQYLHQQPITMAGLIHKGEPLIGNLDGIKRGKISGMQSFLVYKLGETLNPLRDLIGDTQGILHTTNSSLRSIVSSE